ncbi:hypothetical protein QFZ74_000274 [Streptomyces sp. V3I7]|nr:hypothetical protein [Streptomyces sp. V3I7]
MTAVSKRRAARPDGHCSGSACPARPQLFSAAGHFEPGTAATNVSRVAGLGYLGMLAGPAVIGPLTHLAPLNMVLFLPVALCVVATAAAGVLRSTSDAPPQVAAPLSTEASASRR